MAGEQGNDKGKKPQRAVLPPLQTDLPVEIHGVPQPKSPELYEAARDGNIETVRTLLNQPDIDVNKGSEGKWTPLHFAARNGRLEVVRLLLRKGADPSIQEGWND